ncbi:MAG: magnetosome biogenesis CDF transporter MamM [Thermodesulfobacteriota bacterium]
MHCSVCYRAVGWVGLVASLALSLLKLLVGLVAGSHAMVADALYSAKDVLTSGLIIVGLRVSSRPGDEKHPYGHGKVEFLITGVISLVFILVTGLLCFFATESLFEGRHEPPHLIALWTAVLALAAQIFLYSYFRCAASCINSPMVRTLTGHFHSDAVSSAAVALSIVGAHYLGLYWLDPLVALFETLHLLNLGGENLWHSVKGMMDSAAPVRARRRIARLASATAGVLGIEHLLTRRIGQELWIDLGVAVDPELTVREARAIGNELTVAIAASIPHVGNVQVGFRSKAELIPEMERLLAEKRS